MNKIIKTVVVLLAGMTLTGTALAAPHRGHAPAPITHRTPAPAHHGTPRHHHAPVRHHHCPPPVHYHGHGCGHHWNGHAWVTLGVATTVGAVVGGIIGALTR